MWPPFVVRVSSALAVASIVSVAALDSGDERFRDVDVRCASGRFAARVRKAEGQERVDDVLARWMLEVDARGRDGTVTPHWSSLIQHRAGERLHFLSDDGLAFVEVDADGVSTRQLVRVWHAAREPYALDATDLAFERGTGAWLGAESPAGIAWFDSPLGPVPQLQLALADGTQRRVDLATGAVFTSNDWTSELVAGPLIAEELRKHADLSFVRGATAPSSVYFGEQVEVVIDGAHPTPGWHFAGFDVRSEVHDGITSVALTPLSIAPPADRPQAQVLQDFRCKATLAGFAPGRYELSVHGRGDPPLPPLELEVRPARPWIELEVRDERVVRLYASGVLVQTSLREPFARRFRVLEADERRELSDAFPGLSTRGSSQSGAYALRWSVDGKAHELCGDASAFGAEERAFVRVLTATERF